MFETEGLTEFLSQSSGKDDIDIVTLVFPSGTVRKMSYCHNDRRYYVSVDGRERLRSDSLDIVLEFFNGSALPRPRDAASDRSRGQGGSPKRLCEQRTHP